MLKKQISNYKKNVKNIEYMKLIQLFKMLLEIKNKVEKLLKKDIED